MSRIVEKEFKWKHSKNCCSKDKQPMEILTPYPKKRNKVERFLDRHNHFMEFIRTMFALTTIILQLIILSKIL